MTVPRDRIERIDLSVDIDLDAEDKRLREAVGRDTAVKIKGKVVHFAHTMTWSSVAMDACIGGDFSTWASEVIHDPDELAHFVAANPTNYQYEAVFKTCSEASGLSVPKSRQSASPSPGTRTRSRQTSRGTTK
jgi:hypothetical protein